MSRFKDTSTHPLLPETAYACYTTLCRMLSGELVVTDASHQAEGFACLEALRLPYGGSVALLHALWRRLAHTRTTHWEASWGSICEEDALIAPVLDCCGTGGTGFEGRLNVSTTVAILLASMGVPVVKFGNKALSAKASSMGSFDFLETLGLALPPHVSLEAQHRLFQSSNLWFLFAPMVYPQLALLQGWRKAFGKPTVFNALGPMLNPMNPQYHWHGVAQPAMASMLKGLAEMLTSHPTSHHPICQRWAWHTTTLNPASAVAFPAYLDEASPEGECHTLAFGETPLGQTTGQDTWKAYTQSLQHQGSPALLPPLLTLDAKLKAFYACLQGTSNTTYTGWQNTVWLNVTGCLWHSGKANTLEEAQEQCRHQVMSGNAYAWYEDVLKPQFLALTD